MQVEAGVAKRIPPSVALFFGQFVLRRCGLHFSTSLSDRLSPQNSPLGLLASIAIFGKVCSTGSVLKSGSHTTGSAEVEKLSDYLRISEAAEYLGVSPNTLRNWVNAGKIIAVRHPVNDYRLFKREDLDALLKQVAVARKKATK
jgi:excisionase family DNA binding protein